ncbi:unnamed protein product [Clonostachys rhizophaga]|uniref:Mid2 domain-containing protein n=1 Tax=Clonostachys rhizophaga TaxID=160324 RepID=A0A9N9VXN8_9HYPO|nr:unnamed protein product [Clonostachys rhizophaga]
MMRSVIFLMSLLGLSGTAISANTFNRPPSGGIKGDFRDNPTYKEGERVEFLWDTDLAYVDVVIWQRFPLPSSATDGVTYFNEPMLQNSTRMSYEWTAVLGGATPPTGEDSVFWLAMYDALANSTKVTAESHYFNVSRATGATTTTTTSSSLLTAASSTSAAASSDASSESATNDDASQGQKSGLSTGAVAGIAVGSTLAGIAIIAACAFFLWRNFQAKKLAAAPETPMKKSEPLPELGEFGAGNSDAHSQAPPHYVQHQNTPQLNELPTPTRYEAP